MAQIFEKEILVEIEPELMPSFVEKMVERKIQIDELRFKTTWSDPMAMY